MKQSVASDARYINIGDLPSGSKPYAFKDLFIRQLTLKELKLISQAVALDDIRHLIRAIDLVIDQDINEVTIGDFFYLLMWLRVNSFPKSPLIVNWHCTAQYYTEVLEDETKHGKVLEASEVTPAMLETRKAMVRRCDTQNSEIVHLSKIDVVCIDDDFKGLDAPFDYPRVALLPEIIEMSKEPELTFILPAAQWIKEGTTLKDKLQYLEEQADLSLFDEASSISDKIVHGVKETVKLRCSNCNSTFSHQLELNPLTFFRR